MNQHGFRRVGKTHPLYFRWQSIKQRCYDPKCESFKYYGGRGIRVCDEWIDSPATFIAWALNNGYKPRLQIDRKDNDGDYSPGNCQFKTNAENMRNRRGIKLNKEKVNQIRKRFKKGMARALGEEFGVSEWTIYDIMSNRYWRV